MTSRQADAHKTHVHRKQTVCQQLYSKRGTETERESEREGGGISCGLLGGLDAVGCVSDKLPFEYLQGSVRLLTRLSTLIVCAEKLSVARGGEEVLQGKRRERERDRTE